MKRRTLTPAQVAARDERRAKFKALWKQVSALPECERLLIADKLGLRTCEGHPLSPSNSYLILLQCPGATVLGGFRQWRKMGRTVRKGEHGCMIWVPCGAGKKATGEATPASVGDGDQETGGDSFFVIGTLFDISQTDELTPGEKFSPEMPAESPASERQDVAPDFIPTILPDPAPVAMDCPAVETKPQFELF